MPDNPSQSHAEPSSVKRDKLIIFLNERLQVSKSEQEDPTWPEFEKELSQNRLNFTIHPLK